MPNIMVVGNTANGDDAVFLAERLMTVQLDSPHFAARREATIRPSSMSPRPARRFAPALPDSSAGIDLSLPPAGGGYPRLRPTALAR
jgi:hypothetical protein